MGAKMNGQEGKAMKSIIAYLVNETREKNGDVCGAWRFILEQWDRLETFLQKQIKLSQINSNLINIIKQIKIGQNNRPTKQELDEEIRRRLHKEDVS